MYEPCVHKSYYEHLLTYIHTSSYNTITDVFLHLFTETIINQNQVDFNRGKEFYEKVEVIILRVNIRERLKNSSSGRKGKGTQSKRAVTGKGSTVNEGPSKE